MREIKFRAWDTESKLFLGGNAIISFTEYKGLLQENIEITQYTGIKDKNGKEIYEGDIVERYGVAFIGTREEIEEIRKTVVEVGDIYYNEDELGYYLGDTSLGVYNGYNCIKVIGNIYENPDLLNKE